MVRKLDELGRIVIPVEIRKAYHLEEGDSLEIIEKDGEIIIKKCLDTYCPKCLKKLAHTDNFCSRCGLNFKEYVESFKQKNYKAVINNESEMHVFNVKK